MKFIIASLTLMVTHSYTMDPTLNSIKSEQDTYYNTDHRGRRITAETLMEIAPQPPAELKQDLQKWQSKNRVDNNGRLLERLCTFRWYDWIPGFGAFKRNKLLQKNGYENLGGHRVNFVINTPDEPVLSDFLVKVSGTSHRLRNMLSFRDEIGSKLWSSYIYYAMRLCALAWSVGKIDTYQTASRMAYNIVLDKWIKERNLPHIKKPTAYLLNLPEKSGCADDACFILESKFKDIHRVIQGSAEANSMPDETVVELVDAMIGVRLWDIHSNLFTDSAGNILLIDLEQPNNSNPAMFFQENEHKYYHNLQCGLQDLLKVFTSPEKQRLIARTFKEHPLAQTGIKKGKLLAIRDQLEAVEQ